MSDMTEQQIQNWRNVLAQGQIGPYAFIMPREQVIAIRDKMQQEIDALKDDVPTRQEIEA